MKHFVNVSLLFFFTTLIVSGLLRFFKPFALVTTNVHIVSGFGVLLLVALHLSSRGKYFMGLLKRQPVEGKVIRHPALLLGLVILVWGSLLASALWSFWPAKAIVGASYEARHNRDIFRDNKRTAFQLIEGGVRVKRVTGEGASLRIDLEWQHDAQVGFEATNPFADSLPQVAIWAEAEDGTVLETLFVSEKCAFSKKPEWGGRTQKREDVLPIWCARYESILGTPMEEQVDTVSSATPMRSFALESYLKMGGQPFVVYVEINVPNDPNAFYHHEQAETNEGWTREGIGQPSVLYEAFVNPAGNRHYFLLDLIGHSGSSSLKGSEVQYEMEELTSAKALIEKILMNVKWPK